MARSFHLLVLFLGIFSMATTYVVKEGGVEVGRWVDHDGKNTLEVIEQDKRAAAAVKPRVEPAQAQAFLAAQNQALPFDLESLAMVKNHQPYCGYSQRISAGAMSFNDIPGDVNFRYNEWRMKNPKIANTCSQMGTRFGTMNYLEIEDTIKSMKLTSEEYRHWKTSEDLRRLERRIAGLKKN